MKKVLPAIDHFESAFQSLLQAQFEIVEWQTEIAVASMTMGIDFWGLWHQSRGQRAIQNVEANHVGERRVIHAKFGK